MNTIENHVHLYKSEYPEKSLMNYIDNIEAKSGLDNIIVEHRSSNPRRDFLFVNKKQGKHIPCKASETINMCRSLYNVIIQGLYNKYGRRELNEKNILVVAFAETATAIGNIIADNIRQCRYVLQTTRETIDNSKQIITFEEEHSHATTQYLRTYDDDRAIDLGGFDYVLFVDDEISTGNTIINFINAIEKVKSGLSYGVASICNWQNAEDRAKFDERDIDVFALITGNLKDANIKMFSDENKPKILDEAQLLDNNAGICDYTVNCVDMDGVFETERLGHRPNRDLTKAFRVIDSIVNSSDNRVRIIGTEEFMYIPIKIGEYIENKYGCTVLCQATTRSSIDVLESGTLSSRKMQNELVSKHYLPSVYDNNRKTYLYNIAETVDRVIIVSDKKLSRTAMQGIVNGFKNSGYAKEVNIVIME